MPRNFPRRYRRAISGVFTGDLAPVGVLSINDPSTGLGLVFRMSIVREDQPSVTTEKMQGYFVSNVPGLTLTAQLWIASDDEQSASSNWVMVGTPLAAIPQSRLFQACCLIAGADAFVQITPSVPMGIGDTLTLFQEEIA